MSTNWIVPMGKAAVAVLSALVIAGCGGQGAGAGGPADASASSTAASEQQALKVSLIASSTVLASDGSSPVDLTAIVTNDAGVAVSGKTVAFSANDPGSGVRIELTQALTDASGVATARLLLNGNNSQRTVTVLAAVDQKTPSELAIQVAPASAGGSGAVNNSRGELTVRIGTDSLIEDLSDQLSYRKRYAVIVSDNAGIPKVNATVLATLRPRFYKVGYWVPCSTCGSSKWAQFELSPAGGIASEDTTDFGVCNAGEDLNNDKVLTPGNVASYTVSSQTDANGLAVINIVYPKSFAQWVVSNLEVTAQVGGTEGFNALQIPLPILAADVQNEGVPPPSISRTRGSLAAASPFDYVANPAGEGGVQAGNLVAGSPFPYTSQTPTCP
ncbi:MAG: Ig-like domain-containing protein [Lautropia sp.]